MTQLLSILDQLSIASPCSADWSAMKGDDHARVCESCEKQVYNLASLTADESLSLIREREGHVCVRLFRRADGTVLTSDCPVGARAVLRRTRQLIGAVSLGMVMILAGLLLPNVLGAKSTTGRFRNGPVAQKAVAWWDDTLVWMGLRTRYVVLGDIQAPTPLPDSMLRCEQPTP